MDKFTELTVEEQQNVNGGFIFAGIAKAIAIYAGIRIADGILKAQTGNDIKGWAEQSFTWVKKQLGF